VYTCILMEILGYFAAVLIGLSLGLIGGGGSILTVPVLVYLFQVAPAVATSYSLFIVGFTSLIGAFSNYRKRQVSIATALLFGSSSIITVLLTRKFIVPAIPDHLFNIGDFAVTKSLATMVLFAVLMIMASISMILPRQQEAGEESNPAEGRGDYLILLMYGIVIGLVTGLLGAGGGFLLIPALIFLVKLPMKKAVGTSLFIIAMNSLIGFLGDLGHYAIDWLLLIRISLLAIAGIVAGGMLAKKIEGSRLRKGFGWFVLVMGIYIIFREFSH
jgi:uncharacterized membrane protein YfcA